MMLCFFHGVEKPESEGHLSTAIFIDKKWFAILKLVAVTAGKVGLGTFDFLRRIFLYDHLRD